MLHRSLLAALAVATAGLAQQNQDAPADAMAAATARLQRSLTTTLAQPSAAFTANWGLDADKNDGQVAMLQAMRPIKGAAHGSWSSDLLHVAFGEDGGDELLFAGRTQIAKDGNHGWSPRLGRFADGNQIDFLPDPLRLLQVLRALDLKVVHREVAAIEDRPVEILTVSLSVDQASDLVWNGALPEISMPTFGMMIAGRIGPNVARPAAPRTQATVDIAFHLDPGTGLLHRVHARSWRPAGAGGRQIFVLGGGAGQVQVQAGGGDGKDEDEDDEDKNKGEDKDAAGGFADGLPVRSRKKTTVENYVLDLTQHGTAPAPALDDRAKQLLGK